MPLNDAQKFAERFNHDGQNLTDANGVEAQEAILDYDFTDGSGIVIAGDGWDFLHAECMCGSCLESEGPHIDCPNDQPHDVPDDAVLGFNYADGLNTTSGDGHIAGWLWWFRSKNLLDGWLEGAPEGRIRREVGRDDLPTGWFLHNAQDRDDSE